MGQLQIRA